MDYRRWTQAAIYCYERGCVCSDCFYKTNMDSKCQMKVSVLNLVRIFGKPERSIGIERNMVYDL